MPSGPTAIPAGSRNRAPAVALPSWYPGVLHVPAKVDTRVGLKVARVTLRTQWSPVSA